MKILLVSTRFPPHKGGVEEVVRNLAENLNEDNEVCILASLDLISESKNFLTKLLNGFKVNQPVSGQGGYKVKRIWLEFPRTLFGYLAFPYRLIAANYQFIKFLKSFNPDVINFHFADSAMLYLWVSRFFTKKPLITSIHGNDLQLFSYKFPYSLVLPRILKDSEFVVVNSKYMKDELEARYPKLFRGVLIMSPHDISGKIQIIPNGLNISYFNSIEAKKYFSEPYVFYVGRLVHKKGVDILLEAFAKAGIENLKMLIEGKGEELGNLQKLAEKLGISDKIVWTKGHLTDEEKIAYMKGAEFGVVPSRIEPFGIVALEFLAAGTPLIAAQTGGLLWILEDMKTCVFCEKDNTGMLTKKIKEVHENKSLREGLSLAGLEEVKNYRWDKISEKYQRLYLAAGSLLHP